MFTPDLSDVPAHKREVVDRFLEPATGPKYLLGRNKYSESVAASIAVDGFIDDFADDTEFIGKPVIRTDNIPSGSLVVSCVVDGRPLTALDRLRRAGMTSVIDYFTLARLRPDLVRPIDYAANNRRDVVSNLEKYEWLYSRLADETSKKTLEQVTQFRLTGDVEWMRGFSVDFERQYFEDFYRFGDAEVFVDGGGFDGQTAQRFAARCADYRRIYYFEPAPTMMAQSRIRLVDVDRVSFIQKGLFSRQDVLKFDATAGSASRISEAGGVEIQVARLDDEISERVTFLKLDVEGAECDALTGAAGHIETDWPKIAACVYHDQRDFWRVPETVLRTNDRYDMYLRHYTEGILETVMYFIPSA